MTMGSRPSALGLSQPVDAEWLVTVAARDDCCRLALWCESCLGSQATPPSRTRSLNAIFRIHGAQNLRIVRKPAMLLGVRVELSCYGFGTLFEVRFQDCALPLIRDAVRYALFFERPKPVGTDPVRLPFYEAISCPHLNHKQCLPESRHGKQCAKALIERTRKHLNRREAITNGRECLQTLGTEFDDEQWSFRRHRDEFHDRILPDHPLRVV